jgi:hypothetical protein
MKIFQVKYNQNHYVYYKSDTDGKFKEDTNLYQTYTDAKDEVNKMTGYEYSKVKESLIKYFKSK